ncbi:hypothetical protein IKQ21_05405 [bacterium]|nr:hypothetical protein [bacterium]
MKLKKFPTKNTVLKYLNFVSKFFNFRCQTITIEENQGIKIACLEEVAYRMGFLTKEQIYAEADKYKKNEYYSYVRSLK